MTPTGARLIAIGAVVGATLRWGLLTSLPDPDPFPWATLVVNLVGCALLGWFSTRPLHDIDRQRAVSVGFCGGLTTFSTFSVELALLRTDHPGAMWLYLLASVVGGVLVFVAGRTASINP
ncbi:MAG: fluoride efflux transporter FluC [Acidimicrobiales bacterium]